MMKTENMPLSDLSRASETVAFATISDHFTVPGFCLRNSSVNEKVRIDWVKFVTTSKIERAIRNTHRQSPIMNWMAIIDWSIFHDDAPLD